MIINIVAIFYPSIQFCKINISLLSLQKQPKTAPNLFQRGVEYGKYVPQVLVGIQSGPLPGRNIYIYIYIYLCTVYTRLNYYCVIIGPNYYCVIMMGLNYYSVIIMIGPNYYCVIIMMGLDYYCVIIIIMIIISGRDFGRCV